MNNFWRTRTRQQATKVVRPERLLAHQKCTNPHHSGDSLSISGLVSLCRFLSPEVHHFGGVLVWCSLVENNFNKSLKPGPVPAVEEVEQRAAPRATEEEAMTVQELIDALEELVEENYRENVEVRLAFQPSWPFEYDVTRAVVAQDDDGEEVLYLGEGGQLGYLPHKPAVALGWAEQHEDEDEDEDEEA